jgi:hypothetical protein
MVKDKMTTLRADMLEAELPSQHERILKTQSCGIPSRSCYQGLIDRHNATVSFPIRLR